MTKKSWRRHASISAARLACNAYPIFNFAGHDVKERTLPIVQPLWLRMTHWLNALAIVVMVTSGWQIYNASPIFKALTFSPAITLGGWLGGALQWHFAA